MSDTLKPYTVVPAGEGCVHCGAGEQYEVVFNFGKDGEEMLSTTYGDLEEAEAIRDYCNTAYEKGRRAESH